MLRFQALEVLLSASFTLELSFAVTSLAFEAQSAWDSDRGSFALYTADGVHTCLRHLDAAPAPGVPYAVKSVAPLRAARSGDHAAGDARFGVADGSSADVLWTHPGVCEAHGVQDGAAGASTSAAHASQRAARRTEMMAALESLVRAPDDVRQHVMALVDDLARENNLSVSAAAAPAAPGAPGTSSGDPGVQAAVEQLCELRYTSGELDPSGELPPCAALRAVTVHAGPGGVIGDDAHEVLPPARALSAAEPERQVEEETWVGGEGDAQRVRVAKLHTRRLP